MRVDPKSMVQRLTKTATRMLESAVGKAASAGHYEITVEHLLVELLVRDDSEQEAALLLRQAGCDPQRLLSRVERTLTSLRGQNSSRPVFSDLLFQWMEDAWLYASVERGESALRSGVLLLQLLRKPGRYSAEDYAELEDLRIDSFLEAADAVWESSPETWEATAHATQPSSGSNAKGGAQPNASAEGALARFTNHLTEAARAGKIDPIFGRHREVRQTIDILCRRRKNNPILVGEPGVGKTALVEGLALAIAEGDVPESLREVELHALDLGALQAGASVRGEFENRLKGVISEVKGSEKPIILFIDEAHTLIGAGGNQGGGDAANLLKPALARGELRTIAATTWAEYKKYFEKDAALERRFQPVKVEEPDEQSAIVMLRGLAQVYEKAHGVIIRDEAVEAAVTLSRRYLAGRQLPDKAVDLLDTAAARLRVERETKPERLVALERQREALDRHKSALSRDLRDGAWHLKESLDETDKEIEHVEEERKSLERQWREQCSVLEQILALRQAAREETASQPSGSESTTRDSRSHEQQALHEKLDLLAAETPLVHVDVDEDAVARTLSSWTGIPLGNMKRDLAETVLHLDSKIEERVIGQHAASEAIGKALRIAHADIRDPQMPIGVFLFVGPSGVGKTETSLALADLLYGGERFLVSINMSEFQEKHSVSRLVGSPPGYVGYGEGGVLTEAVRQRPYSVVLLDECEKADLDVMNLFYQVFDKGVLSDGEGREIDFRNTIVILTSNLASEVIMQNPGLSSEELAKLIRPVLSQHFKPALLARMNIVPFVSLGDEALRRIAELKLQKITNRVEATHGVSTTVAPELLDALTARCTVAETGARNLDHILRGSLMPELARKLIEATATESHVSKLHLGYEAGSGWVIELS